MVLIKISYAKMDGTPIPTPVNYPEEIKLLQYASADQISDGVVDAFIEAEILSNGAPDKDQDLVVFWTTLETKFAPKLCRSGEYLH